MCHHEAGIIRSRLVYADRQAARGPALPLVHSVHRQSAGQRRISAPALSGRRLARAFVCSPIWAETSDRAGRDARDEVTAAVGLPLDRPIAVFGGQFSEGRGHRADDRRQLASAERAGARTLYLFIGDGRFGRSSRMPPRSCANIRVEPPVPRARTISRSSALATSAWSRRSGNSPPGHFPRKRSITCGRESRW